MLYLLAAFVFLSAVAWVVYPIFRNSNEHDIEAAKLQEEINRILAELGVDEDDDADGNE